jgi:two-component system OmpR family response regulator
MDTSAHGRARVAETLRSADSGDIRVLVVDDEQRLTDLLKMALRYEGWKVQAAHSGQEALELASTFMPHAIVLDVMLPDLDGLTVLSRLREFGDDTPVLFLTAKDTVGDRIAGLTVGGDDYVTKPFSLQEVVLRLHGLIRRTNAVRVDDPVLVVGDLTANEDTREVRRGGEHVHLTATEFELLRFLMRNPGIVLSKTQILDRVWNYDFDSKSTVVELYISYLRKKLETGRAPMIRTVRGIGYMLQAAEDPRPEPAAASAATNEGS